MASSEGEAPRDENLEGGAEAPDERTPLLSRNPEGTDENLNFIQRVKRARRDRWLSLCVSIVLMIIAIALIVLFGVYRSRRMTSGVALCTTPACIHAASEFLNNLSPNYKNVDPCTNFDAYVCDGWRAKHNMRPDQGQVSSMSVMLDENQRILRNILEGPYPGESSHSHFSPRNIVTASLSLDQENWNTMQGAYNACMATDDIKKIGLTPLETMLKELSETFDNTTTWAKTMLYLERVGVGAFVGIGVQADDKAPDTQIVTASPRSSPGLPSKPYYQDTKTVSDYQSAMEQVLGAFPSMSSSAKKLAAGIVDFEKKLAAATPDKAELQDIQAAYNPMSLKDTVQLAPVLGLDVVLKSLIPANYTIEMMITSFPKSISNMSSIISAAPKDVVEGYFQWRVIQSFYNLIDSPAVKPYSRFVNMLNGKDPDAVPDRYRTCISSIDGGLGWILSRFFIEVAFSAKAKTFGDQIVNDIKKTFIQKIKTLDWMDDSVKDVAIQKVNNIKQKIGYPTLSPNITDPSSLNEYYKGLNITHVHWDNVIAIRKMDVKRSWSALGKPTDRNEWDMTADTVNAYYNPPGNEIVFPAGIMQFPLFDGQLPGYVNYGGFGAVSGHELSHAFDNSGSQYDVDGVLKDWWTENTIKEFKKRAHCFVDEYFNFTVQGTNGPIKVNGTNTLGENIADSGGLSAAWSAWQDRRKSSPDPNLPGFESFTQEQMFYIAFGNVWCSKATPAALQSQVNRDEHSPAMWRIMGTAMMNSRGFKQAFNCPVKEPTCELW